MASNNLKVSVCVTTKDESRDSIEKLLDALNGQTLKPDEVIMVDASTKSSVRYQVSSIKKLASTKLQVIHSKGASRARGRNEAIKLARNEIITTTDVGCVPRRDWLKNITNLFRTNTPRGSQGPPPRNIPTTHPRGVHYPEVAIVNHSRGGIPDVVAGFYKMTYENSLQKAMRVFLGVLPSKFDDNFMPSARSMAFTKTIWKKAGGFPENLDNTAEDTLFNVNLIKAGAKFIRVKNAVVEWGMPESISKFQVTIFKYAMGDAQSGIWFHPVKGFQSHNIKILSIYLRYAVSLWLLVIGRYDYLTIYLIIYSLFAFRKARIWGILLQAVSDLAVMAGFARGILKRCVKI